MTDETEARVMEMRAALETGGMILTPRRARLIEILAGSELHPSVSDIHQEVNRSFGRTSLATIYNTIELLKKAGQVLEIEFSGAANRYDGRIPNSHPHVICLDCEKVEDLHISEPGEALDAVSEVTGYQIVRRRVDYFGVCPDCRGRTGER